MAHDVFISHSTRDKPVSDAVCAALENAGIRCWVAPRDVQPGRSFAGEITRAIQQSKAMVLIFSANSNNSSQVLREVQLAVDSQLHILQFRIEEVLLNDDLKYYLSTPHWLDAMTPPLENHLDRLATSIHALLGKPPAAAERKNGGPVAPKGEERVLPIQSLAPAKSPWRIFWLAALAGVVVVGGIFLGMILLMNRAGPQPAAPLQPLVTATASAAPSVIATQETAKPFQRSWDFSAGMLADTRTEGVEVVDASVWKMAGGKHLRFLTGGRSFLEAVFDVSDGTQSPARLTVRHLSSSPDGTQPGYSPVRITLNGNEVFRGSPAKSGWMEEEIDLGNYAQPGRNTLLWEYLDGAQTHYWLKSFRLRSGKQ
jgi:hypothetical protein